jgi:nucleotide-binding universal stress UspA family protein
MTATAPFGAILVPTDFSPPSLRALDVAASLRPPDGEITLLHVIDTELAARAHKLGLASREEVIAKMRARAQEECAWLSKERASDFEVMVVKACPSWRY